MKIWKSYGSEHSSDLIMIGKFKSVHDAEEAKELLDSLFIGLEKLIEYNLDADRFPEKVRSFLHSKKIYTLQPQELNQFLLDIRMSLAGDTIKITTEEHDISALQKILFDHGAKVEIFSGHDYPDER